MNQNNYFKSISSDGNLFDFEMMLKRIKRDAGITPARYMEFVRNYIAKKYPEMTEAEHATASAIFVTAEMTYKHFLETLDALKIRLYMSIELSDVHRFQSDASKTFFKTDIDELGLPVRVTNALRHAGDVRTYGDLVKLNKDKVLRIKNFGPNAWTYLENAMRDKQLTFGMFEAPAVPSAY